MAVTIFSIRLRFWPSLRYAFHRLYSSSSYTSRIFSGSSLPTYESDSLFLNDENAVLSKYEIITNKDDIIVAIEENKGNAVLLKGGHCYSGHGTGAEYLKKLGLKVGNSIYTNNGKISYSKKKFHSIDNFNGFRSANYLCVYNKGKATNCNPYGFEVSVVNGVAQSAPVYGKGHMTIPEGGYVISGHGDAGIWMKKNIKKGSKISIIDNKKIRID